jgi:hypothetical protein
MIGVMYPLEEFDPYYDEIEVRQSYERDNTQDTKVTLTSEVKIGVESDFEKTRVKVIDIGPDPPLCVKRYIWGRKSKLEISVIC